MQAKTRRGVNVQENTSGGKEKTTRDQISERSSDKEQHSGNWFEVLAWTPEENKKEINSQEKDEGGMSLMQGD